MEHTYTKYCFSNKYSLPFRYAGFKSIDSQPQRDNTVQSMAHGIRECGELTVRTVLHHLNKGLGIHKFWYL